VQVNEFQSVIDAICKIDAEQAEAGSQKDRDMIFEAVRTLPGGFHTLNVTVLGQMRRWLLNSTTVALAELGLKVKPRPLDYRCHCVEPECEYGAEQDSYENAGAEKFLSFGNWHRCSPGTKDEQNICNEHYFALGRLKKMPYKNISCVADL
jgi:hypothetical protein